MELNKKNLSEKRRDKKARRLEVQETSKTFSQSLKKSWLKIIKIHFKNWRTLLSLILSKGRLGIAKTAHQKTVFSLSTTAASTSLPSNAFLSNSTWSAISVTTAVKHWNLSKSALHVQDRCIAWYCWTLACQFLTDLSVRKPSEHTWGRKAKGSLISASCQPILSSNSKKSPRRLAAICT